MQNPYLANIVKLLNDSNTTREITAAAGKRFLVSLYDYNGSNIPSLNHLKYISYKKSVFKYNSTIVALLSSAAAA